MPSADRFRNDVASVGVFASAVNVSSRRFLSAFQSPLRRSVIALESFIAGVAGVAVLVQMP